MKCFQFNEAKQVGDIYHICSIRAMTYNAKNDSLSGRNWFGNSLTTDKVISFTRDKNYIVCTHSDTEEPVIQLVIDGNLLSENKKVQPYNDWYYREMLTNIPDPKYHNMENEFDLPDLDHWYDIFYAPENYNMPKDIYDDLKSDDWFSINDNTYSEFRCRIVYDYCKFNDKRLPYYSDEENKFIKYNGKWNGINSKTSENRPQTDRQAEEIVIGNITDLHKYIKQINFTVGNNFFLNYFCNEDNEELNNNLLNNLKECISYFDKYNIHTSFKKLDYTYKNLNHRVKTNFSLCNNFTDLKSLYIFLKKLNKRFNEYIIISENLKSLFDYVKEEDFNLRKNIYDYMVENKIEKPYDKQLLTTKDYEFFQQKIQKIVNKISSLIFNILKNQNIFVKIKNNIKQCDFNYLKRYFLNKILVLPKNANYKDLLLLTIELYNPTRDIWSKRTQQIIINNNIYFPLLSSRGKEILI